MASRTGCLLLPLFFIVSARVILVNADCSVTTGTCQNTADILCASCSLGDKVPNPLDCSSYYVCYNATSFLFDDFIPCPDGQIFNQTDLECVKDNGKCEPLCNDAGGGGGCSYTCNGNTESTSIADPFDCSVYHECNTNNVPGPAVYCPVDIPYFGVKGCVADESACCHCRPYCYGGEVGKKVEDPTDCRKFFFCLEENKIPTASDECSDGEHFDMHAGQCSSTAPCVTLCRNVVDENGCIDPYTCQELGYFPKCKTQCLREYYHCVEVSDDYATPETCPNNLVFNPDTLTCIKNETCPYTHK